IRGTPSCITTSASFPSCRRIWPHAKAEPIPSPSGRACDVTTKRRRSRISCSTRSSIESLKRPRVETRRAASPFAEETPHAASLLGPFSAALLGSFQQFLHPAFHLVGTIHLEEKFRRTPEPQTLR